MSEGKGEYSTSMAAMRQIGYAWRIVEDKIPGSLGYLTVPAQPVRFHDTRREELEQ